ncbi:MAG: class I SAM-dependent methyltransferase, partial [Pyrinomonadaceae bacterium]
VVDGIPVMLLDEVEQTLWVGTASLARSRTAEGADATAEPVPYADTLGISPVEFEQLLNLSPNGAVDPVVQMSVARTCGNLYVPLVGKLDRYPIPELRLPASQGERFLEVGCNWGRWCVAAARKGYLVVGLDPSLGAVLAARRVCQQLGVSARFVVGDGRYLPFAPGVFDITFAYAVFHSFSKENARMALKEMERVLRSGGRALVQLPNFFGLRCFYNNARRGFREATEFEVRFWRLSEMRKVFANLFGNVRFSVDGYFGLGVQETDIALLPPSFRMIVRSSSILRRLSLKLPFMKMFADSIFVHSERTPRPGNRPFSASQSNGKNR